MNRRSAATHIGTIHHIVMQQSEVMKHFQSYRLVDSDTFVGTKRLGGGKHEHGAYAFSPAVQCIGYRLIKSLRLSRIMNLGKRLVDIGNVFFFCIHVT